MNNIIERNGAKYYLYWDMALDGKTWCRVRVEDKRGAKYQWPYYYKTKKAAKNHILSIAAES